MFSCSGTSGGNIGEQRICAIQTFAIFEGTEQIQQLMISPAISGVRIQYVHGQWGGGVSCW
jgi:hypothetical protein